MRRFLLSATLLLVTLGIPRHLAADGIPLCTSVRSLIPDDDWRQVASRYRLVMTLFSPTAGGKDLSREGRVHLFGKWRTAEGQAVVSPLVLPARTGAILLREAAQETK